MSSVSSALRQATDRARAATLRRVRNELRALARDWKQSGAFVYTYKHGRLAVPREHVAFVADDVDAIGVDTVRHSPSLTVWTRAHRQDALQADFSLSSDAFADAAAVAGREALDLLDHFIESRPVPAEAAVIDARGKLVGVTESRVLWTHWLLPGDLPEEQWREIGHGPSLTSRPASKQAVPA